MSDTFFENDQNLEDTPVKFEDLVGDGKKYRDPDAAAKALKEKDSFIEKLQRENAEARAELRARMNLEEVADKVARGHRTPVEPETPRQENVSDQEPTKSEEKLEDTIAKYIKEHETKQTRSQNVEAARKSLRETYGGNAEQAVKKTAESLGVSEAYLLDMAATSPSGFVKVVTSNVTVSKDPVNPPSTDRPFVNDSYTRKNNAYYSNMRKTDPKRYFSRGTQTEMHKEAMRQGPEFYT